MPTLDRWRVIRHYIAASANLPARRTAVYARRDWFYLSFRKIPWINNLARQRGAAYAANEIPSDAPYYWRSSESGFCQLGQLQPATKRSKSSARQEFYNSARHGKELLGRNNSLVQIPAKSGMSAADLMGMKEAQDFANGTLHWFRQHRIWN